MSGSLRNRKQPTASAASASDSALLSHQATHEDDGEGSGVESSTSSSPKRNGEQMKRELRQQSQLFEAQAHTAKHERPIYRKARFLLPVGILIGVLMGLILIQPLDLRDFHTQLLLFLDEYDFAVKLPDLDLSAVEIEWLRFKSNIPEVWKLNNDGREFQAGEAAKARGLTAKHPVVLIPGIVSTSLESWSTEPEYKTFFREKMWGGFNMITQVTFNRDRWISAMMLDPHTGLDPPGAKVRAAEGIAAASSFVQGYWIWSKIIENLAVVNYDTNNLQLAPYDWRLSLTNLEERDGYFSRLKSTIEGLRKRQDRKVVLAAHSMGSTVILYFFKWVESPEHGNGGSDWVENHIETYITIAGTHLGVAKAMSAFLSGEMKDTVQMNPAGAYVLERFFSRKERQKLFRSWAGSASMWIKGGSDVWGNDTWAPDDPADATHTHGELIAFRSLPPSSPSSSSSSPLLDGTGVFGASAASVSASASANPGVAVIEEPGVRNMTADEASTWILERTPSAFQKMIGTNYSFGIERDEEALRRNDGDPTKWSNPLEVRLPNAPSMRIICVYGHGKDTERSYWYAHGPHESEDLAVDAPTASPVCDDTEWAAGAGAVAGGSDDDEAKGTGCSPRMPFETPLARTSWIDSEYTDEGVVPKVRNGVKMGEGDGTVSLLSLGAMCVEGWKRPRWNPGGINITTVELPHRPVPTIPRGGANTSDHVDILGSTGLNDIILKAATGAVDEIEDSFVSRIREYAAQIRWD